MCPEPVLANDRFGSETWTRRDRVSYLQCAAVMMCMFEPVLSTSQPASPFTPNKINYRMKYLDMSYARKCRLRLLHEQKALVC